jgi:hypothetical protein
MRTSRAAWYASRASARRSDKYSVRMRQGVQVLAKRRRAGQLSQLCKQLSVAAHPQVSFYAQFLCLQAQLGQARDLLQGEQRHVHAGQRLPAPQGKRGGSMSGCERPGAVPGAAAGRGQFLLHGDDVQLARLQPDDVAARLGHDPVPACGAERQPQAPDVVLDRYRRRRGR